MAKGNNKSKRQGLFSWATSIISLGIALSDVFARAGQALTQFPPGKKFAAFGEMMIGDYTGFSTDLGAGYWSGQLNDFRWKRLIRGYAPIAGGIAFKKGMAYEMKVARVRSLIPRLGISG